MAQSAKQYFEKLFRDAGMDETTMAAALTAISHEKVAGNADHIVKVATEDYNAQVGRVRSLESKMKEYSDWYGTANAEYQQMKTELDQLRSGHQSSQPLVDTNKFLTKDDLAAYDKERAEKFATTLKQTAAISARHAAQFGEAPDMDAIDRIATEQNLPLNAAYERYIQPRMEEKQKKEVEDRIKREREEAVRDALSKHRLPIDPTPTESSPFFSKPVQQPVDVDTELANMWNERAKY